MKPLLVAMLLFFAAPGVAFAGASLAMREVPLHGERTLAATTPEFDLVGLHWRGSGAVQFRTRSPAGKWGAWRRADPEAEDLPNAGTAEARAEGGWRIGNPYWTGAADAIQYRLHGRVERLRAYFVRSPEVRIPLRRVSMVGSPLMLSREVWGAPHRRHELLHRFAVRGDRPGDRDLPRQGERLERHRLQLSRRQVRAGVRR
jgi:hypothetical protein